MGFFLAPRGADHQEPRMLVPGIQRDGRAITDLDLWGTVGWASFGFAGGSTRAGVGLGEGQGGVAEPWPKAPDMRRPMRPSSPPKRRLSSRHKPPWRRLRQVPFHDPGLTLCGHIWNPVEVHAAADRDFSYVPQGCILHRSAKQNHFSCVLGRGLATCGCTRSCPLFPSVSQVMFVPQRVVIVLETHGSPVGRAARLQLSGDPRRSQVIRS